MDKHAFKESAKFIAKRNVSERVLKVVASFDPELKSMRIVYYINGIPIDDDWDECELTCSELIAEFPEIENAETQCISFEYLESGESVDDIVFLR